MPYALLLEYLVDSNENAGLLHISEAVVDGSTKHFHCWAESHICVDKWRDIDAQLSDFQIENAVVVAQVILVQYAFQFGLVGLYGERCHRYDEVFLVAEMFVEEIEYHVAPLAVVGGIHGHLSEEVFHAGHDYGERSEAVPQIVEGEKALGPHAAALVGQCDIRACQFHCVGQVFLDEFVGEAEHVAGGEYGLAVFVEVHLIAEFVAVASYDFLSLWIPYYELLVAVVHRVEFVEVERFAGAASRLAEHLFTLAAYFSHHVGGIMYVNNINLVVALVGHPQLFVWGEFAFKQFFVYWGYDLFHMLMFFCGVYILYTMSCTY